MQLKHLKPGTEVIVFALGTHYEGTVKGVSESEIFLKGATREWVLPMNQITEIKPKTQNSSSKFRTKLG